MAGRQDVYSEYSPKVTTTMPYNKEASLELMAMCQSCVGLIDSCQRELESLTGMLETRLQELVFNGADPNFQHKSSFPLCEASRQGNHVIVEFLASHGALVDVRDQWGAQPLHIAVSQGHREVVKILINHGADVNANIQEESTPLMIAVQGEFMDVANLLIGSGAQVNVPLRNRPLINVVVEQGNDHYFAMELLNAGSSPFYRMAGTANFVFRNDELLRRPFLSERMTGLRRLVDAGFKFSFHESILEYLKKYPWHRLRSGNPTEEAHTATELVKYTALLKTEVPSLEQLCRPRIRHELAFSKSAGHIRQKIDQLPLPEQVKAFLKLEGELSR